MPPTAFRHHMPPRLTPVCDPRITIIYPQGFLAMLLDASNSTASVFKHTMDTWMSGEHEYPPIAAKSSAATHTQHVNMTLHSVVSHSNVDCGAKVQFLLEKWDADPNTHIKNYAPVLEVALRRDKTAVVKELLEHNATVGSYFRAGLGLKFQTTKLLVDYGANPNLICTDLHSVLPQNAIGAAAAAGQLDTIEYLCSIGVSVNYSVADSSRLLFPLLAVKNRCSYGDCSEMNCDIETVDLLLQHGAIWSHATRRVDAVQMCPPQLQELADRALDRYVQPRLAVAMSLHPRLGERSVMRWLDPDLLRKILDQASE